MLEGSGLLVSQAQLNIDEIRRCADLLLEDANGGSLTGSAIVPDPKLTTLSRYLGRVFRGGNRDECIRSAADYRVFICEEEPAKGSVSSAPRKRTLNYWRVIFITTVYFILLTLVTSGVFPLG